jgi:hypothetical protein
MNLLAFLKPRRSHTEVRYVHSTAAENKLARRKAIDRQLELAVAICHLTPEQRAFAKLRAANSRSMENGRGRG